MKKAYLLGVAALIMLAMMGCQQEENNGGDKNTPEVKFTLTVTGLPAAAIGKIYGASLLSSSSSSTPIAIGMQDASKAFVLYQPNATGTFPDFDKLFTTPGTYTLAIASADLNTYQYDEIYMYKETISYSASNTSITVDWSNFEIMGGEPSAASTVITINNKPANAGVLAVMDGGTQIALGLNMTGSTFTLYEPGAMGPSSTPWKGTGDYSILLINISTQAPVASYLKMEGTTPNQLFSFTGQAAITLDYETDFIPIP